MTKTVDGNFITCIVGAVSMFAAIFLSEFSEKNYIKRRCYVWCVLAFTNLGLVCAAIIFGINRSEWIITIALLLTSDVAIGFLMYNLKVKYHLYSNKDLDKIILDFTDNAQKSELRLFGGDLNFFGNTIEDMDDNKQFLQLKQGGFKSVLILCEEPKDENEKLRYGRVLCEIKRVTIHYYNDKAPDVDIRGRIKIHKYIPHFILFNKVKSNAYVKLEGNVQNHYFHVYDKVWTALWNNTDRVACDRLNKQCKKVFKEYSTNDQAILQPEIGVVL